MNKVFECALTGEKADGFELPAKPQGITEGLPPEWVEITVRRRVLSQDWLAIREVKQRQLQSILAQIPEEVRDQEAPYVAISVEASFSSYEDKIGAYIIDYDEKIFVSPDAEAKGMLNEILETLGAPPLDAEEESDEDDGDEG